MLESKIQSSIIKYLEDKGYYVIKIIRANKNGIPDLIILKNAQTFFIEAKAEKGKLSILQEFRIKELQQQGFKTLIIKSIEELQSSLEVVSQF